MEKTFANEQQFYLENCPENPLSYGVRQQGHIVSYKQQPRATFRNKLTRRRQAKQSPYNL